MAAFASCRRAGWVRYLVVLLCALFLFATLGAPAARAEALTVGLFTVAAVLSAATAALGFKLSNSTEGQATLAKMAQDFKVSATAVGLVLVGSKINGLIDGVDYIKMQVKAGKTYLDERVVAWVQQWLGVNGVYNTSGISIDYSQLDNYKSDDIPVSSLFSASLADVISAAAATGKFPDDAINKFHSLASKYNLYNSNYVGFCLSYYNSKRIAYIACYPRSCYSYWSESGGCWVISHSERYDYPDNKYGYYDYCSTYSEKFYTGTYTTGFDYLYAGLGRYAGDWYFCGTGSYSVSAGNDTGLSGTDTIGKDVVDKSLDEVLAGLKEWAPDWWDAGADSSTNGAAAGAKDLPLNMGSGVKTVTGNPALEVDQPLIYTPWFDQTLDNLRNGETAGTVTNTATSAAETADKADAAQGTVEDAQGVVQSIISWGLDYISPDKGLFSRFPLCIPYDAYLLVTAALGVDAQDLGDIVGQSPGELSAQVDDGVAVQSDIVPVLSVKHDWTQDGVTTPVEVTIDLRPYDAVIKMIRTLVSVYVIAELIASEYKRIRGS